MSATQPHNAANASHPPTSARSVVGPQNLLEKTPTADRTRPASTLSSQPSAPRDGAIPRWVVVASLALFVLIGLALFVRAVATVS